MLTVAPQPAVSPSANVVSPGYTGAAPQQRPGVTASRGASHAAPVAGTVAAAGAAAARRARRRRGAHRRGDLFVAATGSSTLEPLTSQKTAGWDREAWIRGYEDATTEDCYEVDFADFPPDLIGTYFRNGPAKFKVGADLVLHPFDGDGMVSAITFDGSGKATFRNRFVRTPGFVEELEAGKMVYRPQFSLKPGGVMANFFDMRPKNLANTNVTPWAGSLMALWEGGKPTRLDPLSLSTLGESSFAGALRAEDNFTAHPRIDARQERLCGFQYKPEPTSNITKLTFWEFSEKSWELARKRVEAEVPGFGFFHDFLVTDNYYVLSLAPTTLSGADALQAFMGFKPIPEALTFDKDSPGKLVLVPRAGGETRFVEIEPHFCFHFSNGFEEDGNLMVDMIRVPDLFLGDPKSRELNKPVWAIADMEGLSQSQMWRYKIDLDTLSWSQSSLCNRHHDFPTVARRSSGQPYRYYYAATAPFEDRSGPLQGLLKVDCQDSSAKQVWMPEPHEFLGEPIFCPRKGGSDAEDDGYLVTFVTNGKTLQSEVVLFDARNVASGPVCRAPLRQHLPHGLHGCWAPDLAPSHKDIQAAWKKTPTSLRPC